MLISSSVAVALTALDASVTLAQNEPEWKAHYQDGIRAYNADDAKTAIADFELALKQCESSKPSVKEFAECLLFLGNSYRLAQRNTDAEVVFRRALNNVERYLSDDDEGMRVCLEKLADLYFDLARYREAAPLYERIIKLRVPVVGPNDISINPYLLKLAHSYSETDQTAAAEGLFKHALQICETADGKNSQSVAVTLNGLASLYQEQNRFSDAEPLFDRALKIYEANKDKNAFSIAAVLNNMAEMNCRQGKFQESEALFLKALSLLERSGVQDPSICVTWNNLAGLYDVAGRFAESEALYKRSLILMQQRFGENSPSYAANLNNLAKLYMHQGRLLEATPLFEQALEIRMKKVGPDTLIAARSMADLAECLYNQRRFSEAESLLNSAISIREKNKERDNGILTLMLTQLANVYMRERKFSNAETTLKHALDSEAKNSQIDNADHQIRLAQILRRLGELCADQDRFEEAGSFFKRASDLRHKAGSKPGASQNFVSSALEMTKYGVESADSDLKLVLDLLKVDGYSEKLTLRAFATLKNSATQLIASPGSDKEKLRRMSDALLCLSYILASELDNCDLTRQASTLSLKTLNLAVRNDSTADDLKQLLKLALLFEANAQYSDCEDAVRKAIAIASSKHEDYIVAQSLFLLARVQATEADYENAIITANDLRQRFVGNKTSPINEADLLDLLGDCHEAIGNTDEAVRCAEKSLQRREASSSNSQDLLPALVTLGEMRLAQKDIVSATRELERARRIVESSKTVSESSLAATVYGAYGDLQRIKGDLPAAAIWYDKARSLSGRLLTSDFTTQLAFAADLNALAKVQLLQGDAKAATYSALSSSGILQAYADSSFSQLSFAQQCTFVDALKDQTDALLSICSIDDPPRRAYSNLMKWKGLLIESLRRKTVLERVGSVDPETRQLIQQLNANHNQLKLFISESSSSLKSEQQAEVSRLNIESESLERQISQKCGDVALVDPLDKKEADDLRKLLGPDEALLDIFSYRDLQTDKEMYAAVLLTLHVSPKFIMIGSADDVNQAISAWRKTAESDTASNRDVTLDPKSEIGKDSSSHSDNGRGSVESKRVALQKCLWEPIAARLPHLVKKLWVCPDSDSATIPWALFTDGTPIRICTIDSAREFASLKQSKLEPNKSPNLLIAGDITFGKAIPRLPATREEINALKSVASKGNVDVQTFSGLDAQASKLMASMPSKTYIHFATHGFYAGPNSQVERHRGRSRGLRAVRRRSRGTLSALVIARNPLMSSGLLLSGGQMSGDTTGEGKLTADDIAGLDLHSCDLVTLSACETGLGKKMSGQGVLGLRSAILSAGARNVLMSLWKVDDDATCQLMTEFYSNVLLKHLAPIDALSQAQQTLRNIPKWSTPFYWAGWVLAGDGYVSANYPSTD